MMNLAELKKSMKKHDDLMGIDPKGKKVQELRKEIEAVGYIIDDENKRVTRKAKGVKHKKKRPTKVDAGEAEEKAPVGKSTTREKKKEMVIKSFLKDPTLHKEIMADERIKKQGY